MLHHVHKAELSTSRTPLLSWKPPEFPQVLRIPAPKIQDCHRNTYIRLHVLKCSSRKNHVKYRKYLTISAEKGMIHSYERKEGSKVFKQRSELIFYFFLRQGYWVSQT